MTKIIKAKRSYELTILNCQLIDKGIKNYTPKEDKITIDDSDWKRTEEEIKKVKLPRATEFEIFSY